MLTKKKKQMLAKLPGFKITTLKQGIALLKTRLRQLHLVLGSLHLVMFIVGLTLWQTMSSKIDPTLLYNKVEWVNNDRAIWSTNETAGYDLVLILWIGALILSLMHFSTFLFWRARFCGLDSFSDRFGKRKDPSSRWVFYFMTTLFAYLTISGFWIRLEFQVLCLLVLLALGGSTIFYLFDKINIPVAKMLDVKHFEELNKGEDIEDKAAELQDFEIHLKDDNSQQTVPAPLPSEDEKYRKLTKMFDKPSYVAWFIGLFIVFLIDLFFVVYNFTAVDLSLAPISFSIVVCVFSVYSLWSVIIPPTTYYKWTSVKHITTTISFHTIVSMTYTTLFIITLVGVYV